MSTHGPPSGGSIVHTQRHNPPFNPMGRGRGSDDTVVTRAYSVSTKIRVYNVRCTAPGRRTLEEIQNDTRDLSSRLNMTELIEELRDDVDSLLAQLGTNENKIEEVSKTTDKHGDELKRLKRENRQQGAALIRLFEHVRALELTAMEVSVY